MAVELRMEDVPFPAEEGAQSNLFPEEIPKLQPGFGQLAANLPGVSGVVFTPIITARVDYKGTSPTRNCPFPLGPP
jgi:hypothetical protein